LSNGGISNTYSYLARASTALSVTLTGLSCLLAGVTMPVLGRTLQLASAHPLDLAVPIPALVGQFLLMLTLPVGIGMWVRRQWPDRAVSSRPAVQRLAFIGVGIMLLLIILDDPRAFLSDLPSTVPLAAVFIALSAAAGWLAAAAVTGDPRDRFTLAAEFGTRNLGVAMAVAVTLLGRIEFARFAYTYFLTELPLMLVAISVFRRRQGMRLTADSSHVASGPLEPSGRPSRDSDGAAAGIPACRTMSGFRQTSPTEVHGLRYEIQRPRRRLREWIQATRLRRRCAVFVLARLGLALPYSDRDRGADKAGARRAAPAPRRRA
jgi:BASS family bile acid:Na+ symporter